MVISTVSLSQNYFLKRINRILFEKRRNCRIEISLWRSGISMMKEEDISERNNMLFATVL